MIRFDTLRCASIDNEALRQLMLHYCDAALVPLLTWAKNLRCRLHVDNYASVVFKIDSERIDAGYRQDIREQHKRGFGGNGVGCAQVLIDVFGGVQIGIESIGNDPTGDDFYLF